MGSHRYIGFCPGELLAGTGIQALINFIQKLLFTKLLKKTVNGPAAGFC